mgnify:CR=1 FL=1
MLYPSFKWVLKFKFCVSPLVKSYPAHYMVNILPVIRKLTLIQRPRIVLYIYKFKVIYYLLCLHVQLRNNNGYVYMLKEDHV